MKRKRFAFSAVVLAVCGIGVAAQVPAPGPGDQTEDEFFSSPDVEAKPRAAENKDLQDEIEKEKVGFSGYLEAQGSYTVTRGFAAGLRGIDDNPFAAAVAGDFLLDVRLKKSYRAFLDLNLGYLTSGVAVTHDFTEVSPPFGQTVLSEEQNTLIGLKEAFVDFNIANVVYFRAGKQVLQWGRGFFWNPTDLINIEHKDFMNLDALREGVFGFRSDVVFARELHLYTFVNANEAAGLSALAFAARAEFLAGQVEFGFSSWVKGGKIPVFGTDVSAPLFRDLNLTGESSFSWGDNLDKMNADGSVYSIRDELVAKASVGLSRSFDAWDVQDRVVVNAEFFYNHTGYDQNIFEELDATGRATFFDTYYRAGYYGRYYAALFVTVNKFVLSDMTLTLSGIGNLSDMSGIAMAAVSYSPVNNFTFLFQVSSFLGADNREYTASYDKASGVLTNNLLAATVGAKVAF